MFEKPHCIIPSCGSLIYDLNVKAEQNYVAVFNNVFLAFHTNDTFLLGGSKTSVVKKILIVDNFCFDETTFKVCMDLAGCLRCFGTFLDGPCTTLIFAGCKETDQAEKTIACCNQFVKTTGGNTQILQVFFLLIIVEISKFLLNLCADNKYFCAFFLAISLTLAT